MAGTTETEMSSFSELSVYAVTKTISRHFRIAPLWGAFAKVSVFDDQKRHLRVSTREDKTERKVRVFMRGPGIIL